MPHWLLTVLGVIFLVGGTLGAVDQPGLGSMSIAGAILLAGQAIAAAVRDREPKAEE